ncbi:GlsB/YeaQ/YmgE family stress response membrane protein [Erythrobacter sp. T5W1-R]|uniref:GlsB/YeaQ/YmgE family stress response membrane protein n=1 Tax=Erythrobacter sp. T5W1-R TaxID=3101752 RepID=UPI002AFEE547|nr:GlsB/YeaQ/YmgE family stress response membrane protein [Erythrobacter sp. T5W1-R]MEA1618705.1 GlsB/YeaQ/YmgE family stress response membrane protein [Erythrobacter sp. T5W1-R]
MGQILGFVWFLLMGSFVGWLASLVMRRDADMGLVANVVVGVIGSFIGNSVFSFIFGSGRIGGWPPDLSGILAAVAGASLLLAIVNLIQRGRLR